MVSYVVNKELNFSAISGVLARIALADDSRESLRCTISLTSVVEVILFASFNCSEAAVINSSASSMDGVRAASLSIVAESLVRFSSRNCKSFSLWSDLFLE